MEGRNVTEYEVNFVSSFKTLTRLLAGKIEKIVEHCGWG
jgi:hypothetical protein